jgi:hypothetical protein
MWWLFACADDDRAARRPVDPRDDDASADTGASACPDPAPEVRPAPTAPASCTTEALAADGGWNGAVAVPGGALVVVGAGPAERRDVDGTWRVEPDGPAGAGLLRSGPDGSAWAIGGDDQLWRREPAGGWSVVASVPPDTNVWADLAVGPDGAVTVLAGSTLVECDHCAFGIAPVVTTWDGTAWSPQSPLLPPGSGALAVDADGVRVVAGLSGVFTLDPTPTALDGSVGFEAQRAAFGPDGTLAVVGTTVLLGTVADGLTERRPPIDVLRWNDVLVRAADDVWVAGEVWTPDGTVTGIVARWTGVRWTVVEDAAPDGLEALVDAAPEVVALGGPTHGVALRGDGRGLVLDREVWGIGAFAVLTVDRERGVAYGIGPDLLLSIGEHDGWRGVPLPTRPQSPFAATDGRVLLVGPEGPFTSDGATFSPQVPVDGSVRAAGGGGGVFVLVGTAPDGRPAVWRDVGCGFVPLSTDGLEGRPVAVWVDDPDTIVVGVDLGDDRGGLARWDGARWDTRVRRLPSRPLALVRGIDGRVWVLFDALPPDEPSLWVFNGDTAAPAAGFPPKVRALHQRPDGSFLVSAVDGTGHLVVAEGSPEAGWTPRSPVGAPGALAGWGTTWWSSTDEHRAVTHTVCE